MGQFLLFVNSDAFGILSSNFCSNSIALFSTSSGECASKILSILPVHDCIYEVIFSLTGSNTTCGIPQRTLKIWPCNRSVITTRPRCRNSIPLVAMRNESSNRELPIGVFQSNQSSVMTSYFFPLAECCTSLIPCHVFEATHCRELAQKSAVLPLFEKPYLA